MNTPAPADLHRWSEELARNPASLAFLPLARAYRRLGRRDLALQLCLRGLEHHPTHVEAHALLALLHFEAGDRTRAAEEWATVLRLKPGNFEALRGMGFRYLEQNDVARARQHLERAALIRPDDTTVQEALRLIRHREGGAARARPEPVPTSLPRPERIAPVRPEPPRPAAPAGPMTPAAPAGAAALTPARPVAPAPATAPVPRTAPAPAPAPRPAPTPAPVVTPARAPAPTYRGSLELPPDPVKLFDPLLAAGPLLGILLLDPRGLVLAGSMRTEGAAVEDLGAIIGAAIDEAVRTVTHLSLGEWRSLVLESEVAVLHVAPMSGDALIIVAARHGTPMGWVLRASAQAASIAERYTGAGV
jgi:tetratricopeptide (TPR) repeat protein